MSEPESKYEGEVIGDESVLEETALAEFMKELDEQKIDYIVRIDPKPIVELE